MIDRKRIEQEIHVLFQHYSNILQIQRPIRLVFSSDKTFGGTYCRNVVKLSQAIIENWDNEQKMCEFILAHELIHAKYDESNLFGLTSILFPWVSVKLALSELRANTIAYQVTEICELDLIYYFGNFYPYPKISFIASSGGYLKGHEYVEFIREHPTWTVQTIEDATAYFKSYSLWYRLVPKWCYLMYKQKLFENVI